MAKHTLRLLFLRKYRTSKKYYSKLKSHATKSNSIPHTTDTCERNGDTLHTSNGYSNGNGTIQGHRRDPQRSSKHANFSDDSVDCCLLIYDCISQYKLRTFVFVILMGIVSSSWLYYSNQRRLEYSNDAEEGDYDIEEKSTPLTSSHQSHQDPSLYRIYREDVFSSQHGIQLRRCAIPALSPFSSEVKPFIFYKPSPNCIHEQRGFSEDRIPFSLKNGSILVRNVEKWEVEGCCYRPFHRSGDSDFWTANACKDISRDEITTIPIEHDYIEILCTQSTGPDFRDGFALIHRKEQVEDRVNAYDAWTNGNHLSVIILGLDATSRMNFIRAMPKSNKYLLKTLSAIPLKGYTKVADNTLPNVIPLLSGITLDEFKKKCVDDSRSGQYVHLDECPFIWNTFAENGFRTAFSEDDVDIGIFNMNWANAFTKPPTDYYLRPYSLLMQRQHSFHHGYCYGPHLSFEKILENLRSMVEVFEKDTYFHFTWSTKLSHDDFNKMRWGDQPLYDFLHYLNTNGYLNKTALIVLGDHGSRLDRIRSTAQGKLEDRMPIAYFVLPTWFQTKYSEAYKNLKKNAELITSAFDIHKTLFNFMNLDSLEKIDDPAQPIDEIFKLPNNETVDLGKLRGSSLFQSMPENRTCFSAGVPLHWCVCHNKLPLESQEETATEGAKFVITYLNTLLEGQSTCATLELQSLDEVSKWDPTEIIREGCVTPDDKNATENINSTSKCIPTESSDAMVLQIAFTTSPSGATFETTVIHMENGRWKITEDVVRTNSYEGQSDCVEQKFKPYCYCSDEESLFGGLF